MTLEIDKSAVVFNGELRSIGTIPKGKYEVKVIVPLDEEKRLTWYQINGTKKIIGLNPENLPKGFTIKAS
ncbi:MAG: hypothetical protein WCP89_01670 [archaeon]